MPFAKGNKLAKGGARAASGPKPLAIRQLCAKAFAERIPVAKQIADDAEGRPADKIAALNLLAKVGLPAQHEVATDAPTAIIWQLPPIE